MPMIAQANMMLFFVVSGTGEHGHSPHRALARTLVAVPLILTQRADLSSLNSACQISSHQRTQSSPCSSNMLRNVLGRAPPPAHIPHQYVPVTRSRTFPLFEATEITDTDHGSRIKPQKLRHIWKDRLHNAPPTSYHQSSMLLSITSD